MYYKEIRSGEIFEDKEDEIVFEQEIGYHIDKMLKRIFYSDDSISNMNLYEKLKLKEAEIRHDKKIIIFLNGKRKFYGEAKNINEELKEYYVESINVDSWFQVFRLVT